jgi:hypothetical protein
MQDVHDSALNDVSLGGSIKPSELVSNLLTMSLTSMRNAAVPIY